MTEKKIPAVLRQFKPTTVNHGAVKDRFILVSEFAKGCYVYQSFVGSTDSTFGDFSVSHVVTFIADPGNGVIAEWEPQYGPIQIWEECGENWKGECTWSEGEVGARTHWHFPFVKDHVGQWAQGAVDDERLKEKLASGDLKGVFDVLMRWANR